MSLDILGLSLSYPYLKLSDIIFSNSLTETMIIGSHLLMKWTKENQIQKSNNNNNNIETLGEVKPFWVRFSG
jgi:hypothetical protein